MTDEIATPTTTESDPVSSTADIAAQVIADAETSSPDTTSESSYQEPSTEPAAPAAPEVVLSPAAQFLKNQGHEAQKKDGRPVWLHYGTVEKMLERYADQHRTGWETEKQTIAREREEARQHLEAIRSALAGDPKAFLSQVAQVDPRYQAFLERQAEARAESKETDPEPGPDYDLGNGTLTYSVEGLKALRAWERRQIQRELDAKLKPLAEREHRVQLETQSRQAYQATMAEAQTWPGFGALPSDGSLTAFQQEVLGELQKDSEQAVARRQRPTMTLRQAYLEVMARQQDPTKVRAQVLAEMKTAPSAPSVSRSGPEPTRRPGPRSTADIARQIIAQAEA